MRSAGTYSRPRAEHHGPHRSLRDEHAELRPHRDGLDTLAADLSRRPPDLLDRPVHAVGVLQDHLVPHAEAKEAVLYPAVDQALGAPAESDTMIAGHRDIVAR